MKMTPEHYALFESGINLVLKDVPKEDIKELRATVHFVNDQFASFCWLITHRAISLKEGLWEVSQNYNGAHIETAIKKILKDYEL